jgi:hypothetical protein
MVHADFAGTQRLSDSDIPPAKAQRRQVLKFCHFDPWEKSFLDRSCSLGMTGIPRHLRAFAGDIPRPTGERSAPYENLRVLRAFVVNSTFLISVAAVAR